MIRLRARRFAGQVQIISIVFLALLLAGCASKGPASIAGGECRIFEAPEYEVRGQRDYDQDWIDSQVEGGIGGCKWKRPAPRPAELDAAPPARPTIVRPTKRRGIVQRIRERVLPAKEWPQAAAPIAPTPGIAAPVPDPAPRPPRSAIDRLLYPRDDD